jgi:hypothetical protein
MFTPLTQRPARILAAVCLIVTALLSVVSVLLQPEFPSDPADRLAAVAESGTAGTTSLLAFALSQLPFMIAAVAIAALAASVRRTAVVGCVLAVLGGFGHAVFSGIGLAYLGMSGDAANRDAMGAVVESIETGPAVVFMAMGLVGTVLGIILLGVALFRSGSVPRWIPVTLWAFVLTEFVGAGLSEWASPAAGLLYLAAFTGLALELVGPNRTRLLAEFSRGGSAAG